MAKKDEVLEEVQKEVPVETPKGAKEKVEDKPLKVKEQPKKPGANKSTAKKPNITTAPWVKKKKHDNKYKYKDTCSRGQCRYERF